MNGRALYAALARPDEERFDALPARLGWPFVPEHDSWFRSRLQGPRLRALLSSVEGEAAAGGARALASRGRLKRALGDVSGAAADLRAALEREPGLAAARCWLAELDLAASTSEEALTGALAGAPVQARLYRALSRLMRGDAKGALDDARAHAAKAPRSALGFMVLGTALERAGRHGAAERAFARSCALDPTCAGAWLLRARAASRGTPAELSPRAAALVEGALNADPSYGFIALSWGAARAASGRPWRRLLARMLRFAFAEPGKAGWYYRLDDVHYAPYHFQEYEDARVLRDAHPRSPWAQALVLRGVLRCPPDPARAAEGLAGVERAIALAPWAGWMRSWRALAYQRARRLPAAEREFDASLRLQPLYHRAHAWRGSVRRRLGRPEEALEDLDREIATDESCPFSAHERSLARRALGDWLGAAADLDRGFALDSKYAWVFVNGREPDRAELSKGEEELTRAIAAHPTCVSLRAWRGDLRRAAQDFSGALADLSAAVAMDPAHANAQGFLGRVLLQAGRADVAREALERAVALAPGRWVFRGWLAEAEFRRGRPALAWRRFDEIVRGTPLHWWALHQRAELRLEAGRAREALKDLRAAEAFEGRHAEGFFLGARARLALGDLAAAESEADKALEVSPNFGRALLLRAEIRRARGRAEAAVEDFRGVYERFPYLFNEEQRARVAALLEA